MIILVDNDSDNSYEVIDLQNIASNWWQLQIVELLTVASYLLQSPIIWYWVTA